ncbi:hypothetical protein GGS26DRAFT_601031 [Hypomontagnella submonticulosa]|nr:hypothetical protein GGS26DRAFT_601031 [Hypomontagnella submonticulosa]
MLGNTLLFVLGLYYTCNNPHFIGSITMATSPSNPAQYSPLGERDESYSLGGNHGYYSTNISPTTTPRARSPFSIRHEDTDQVPSPSFNEEQLTGTSTVIRRPLPFTSSVFSPSKDSKVQQELPSPPYKSNHKVISTRGSNWNREVGGLVLSVSSLVTIIALLAYNDGRPLAQWNAFLSLNTLISILGAISRTSLGFAISSCLGQAKWNWFKKRPDSIIVFDRIDDASRGPWGSLWLIIGLKTFHWVCLGATVTIVLLGFEPLLQAVISYSGQMDPSTNSSSIQLGRSEVLDVGLYSSSGSSGLSAILVPPSNMTVMLETYASFPDIGMQSAFSNGLYNSTKALSQSASFVCPTANCTWPTFTSMAVCSACNDVTTHLQRRKEYGTNLGTLTQSGILETCDFTTYYLPRLDLTNPSNSTVTEDNALYYLLAYMKYEAGNLTWDETSISATECAMYFCVNAYQSIVERGILSEHIIASWAERDFNSYLNIGTLDNSTVFDAYEKWHNYSLYADNGDVKRSDLELFIPENDIEKYKLPKEVAQRFRLTQHTIGSTTRLVNEDFLNSEMVWPVKLTTNDKALSTAQALYDSKNLSATFDRAASSVSNWMRDISNITTTGKGQEWVIHIRVIWPYMILPMLAMASGLAFCLRSILETHALHLEPWKTGMISTLTHSVDAETRAQLRHAERNGYLKPAVRAMTVSFEDVGCGLELKIKQE